eukprot:Ihof_evm1s688 gene=Ihof_evmTU1s688
MNNDLDIKSVSALPYVDQEYNDPAMKARVDELIIEEMMKFTPRKDALSYLGGVTRLKFQHAPILETEYKRVVAGTAQSPFDVSRYAVDTSVADKDKSIESQQRTIEKLQTVLAHQDIRIANAELLVRYGRQAWLGHTNQLDQLIGEIEAEIQTIQKETHDLNVQRTLEQTEAGGRLHDLATQWTQLLAKNMEVAQACTRLEGEINLIKDTQMIMT